MGIHGLKPFRFCLLLLLVATSLHCARESSKKEDGTQNTGGGVVFNSTKEQVNEALDLALKLATEPDMTKNVFVQFWKDWGQSDKNELIAKPTHLFSRAETAAKAGNEVTPNERFESPALMALSKDKILRSDKDCAPSETSEHTDGSVSSLTIDADVCFSVRNLMRLPPSSLLRQILSLVLHEAVHMGGGEEPEAARPMGGAHRGLHRARDRDAQRGTRRRVPAHRARDVARVPGPDVAARVTVTRACRRRAFFSR